MSRSRWLQVSIAIVVAALFIGNWVHQRAITSPSQKSPVATSSVENGAEAGREQEASAKPDAAVLDADYIRNFVLKPYMGDGKPSKAEKLSTALHAHLDDTRALLSKLQAASDNDNSVLVQQLEAKQVEFDVVQGELAGWLAENDAQGTELAQQIDQRFGVIQDLISGIIGASSPAARAQIAREGQQTLAKYVPNIPPQKAPALMLRPVGPPAESGPTPPPADSLPAYMQTQVSSSQAGSSHDALAQTSEGAQEQELGELLGWLKRLGVQDAHAASVPSPIPPQANACSYIPADLGDGLTGDAVFEVDKNSAEIIALASDLEYSPLKIYAYIKNNIELEYYSGSLKGALGVLKSGAGNDTDQASLLIALLRASNYPARYVSGRVTMSRTDSRLLNWLGVTPLCQDSCRF